MDLINAQLNDDMDVQVTVIGVDSDETYSIENELHKYGEYVTRLKGPRMLRKIVQNFLQSAKAAPYGCRLMGALEVPPVVLEPLALALKQHRSS